MRGTRGEIINDTVHYLNASNLPETARIVTDRDSVTGEALSVSFRGETLYTPPFGPCGLPDDETAIACLLAAMAHYLETGEEYYSLAEALEDAELGDMMVAAANHPWSMQHSVLRPWKPDTTPQN